MDYSLMLQPGRIGSMELKNRVVFPAMDAGLADNEGNEKLARYMARRAEGGCGLLFVEVSAVHPSTSAVGEPRLYDDKYLPGYAAIADAVHAAGGKVGVQLWHAGRQLFAPDFDEFPDNWPRQIVSCSAISCSEVVPFHPRELTTEEVYEIIEAYGDAAVRAQKAGFDCVEIHGAHGYLVDQFLNEYTNHRSDEFGGSFEARCRFGELVVENVRSKVGPDFPVIMRLNAFEGALQPGGIEIEDAVRAAKRFAAHGLDALDISQGSYDIEDIQVPAYYYPEKFNAANAAVFKRELGLPVICAGRLNSPELCEEVLTAGQADFVAVGRGQLADPDFVLKAAEGRTDELMRCIGCEQGCVQHIFDPSLGGIGCVYNAACGREDEAAIVPAEQPKRLLVIGAGPAGLELARVAALRGHTVEVLERAGRIGGQLNIACKAPHKQLMLDNAHVMATLAQHAGARIRLQTEATPSRIERFEPDLVVLATGARPAVPPIPGIERAHDAWKVIEGLDFVKEQDVVVLGGGLVGLEATEILCEQGKHVTIIEMAEAVARDVASYTQQHTRWMLQDYGVDIRTSTTVLSLDEGSVRVRFDGREHSIAADAVVCALGSRPNNDLLELLKEMDIPYAVVGDAARPGKILTAVREANKLGRSI